MLQIAFIDNVAKVGELAEKFGFEKKDVINLKPGRSSIIFGSLLF